MKKRELEIRLAVAEELIKQCRYELSDEGVKEIIDNMDLSCDDDNKYPYMYGWTKSNLDSYEGKIDRALYLDDIHRR